MGCGPCRGSVFTERCRPFSAWCRAACFLLLTVLAFFVLPMLVWWRRFRPWFLRVFFSLAFVAGFVSMAELIGRSEHVGFDVYLWLLAAVAATAFCLLPQDDT